MRRALCLAAGALLASACGAPSADLFEVQVTGPDRNANYRLLVSDAGSVRCNDGDAKPIGDERLIEARAVAREIEPQAALALELPPEKNSILRFRARLESGTVEFSDTSRSRPKSFSRLIAFTTDVAENVCGLER